MINIWNIGVLLQKYIKQKIQKCYLKIKRWLVFKKTFLKIYLFWGVKIFFFFWLVQIVQVIRKHTWNDLLQIEILEDALSVEKEKNQELQERLSANEKQVRAVEMVNVNACIWWDISF